MKQISIANSYINGIVVVLLGKNQEQLQEIEARTENDPDLQRINVYSVAKAADFSKTVREYSANLVIVEDGTDDRDFVFLQMEARQASPGCSIIPLIATPSIGLVRTAQKNGGLVEIGDPADLNSYQKIKNYIVTFALAVTSNDLTFSELKPLKTIQKALIIGRQDWLEKKELSSECVNQLLPLFDLSVTECKIIVSAEKVFVPWLTFDSYLNLLGSDYPAILKALSDSASWIEPESTPKSISGLIISAANFIASLVVDGDTKETITAQFELRPSHLKHPGIRTLTREKLSSVLQAIMERNALTRTG
jgi:hypothetical protein